MDFAVHIEGLHEEGNGTWVLAVEGERVLITHEHEDAPATLHWHDLSECTFIRAATPDQPRLVMAVQPKQRPELITPNRVMRRMNGQN